MAKSRHSIAKITRPNAAGIVPRQRLFHLLDSKINSPILWISGPPGSGKTFLVASYLDYKKLPCLWYQIDGRDADIAAFFYYLGMATQKTVFKTRRPLPLLTPEYLAGISVFTKRYFEDLYSRLIQKGAGNAYMRSQRRRVSEFPVRFILVFDNYQEVPAESGFHEMIIHGLDVIPEGINVFILSRSSPPAQFARLQASERIGNVGWNDLRFTLEETRDIFWKRGERELKEQTLFELHRRTEGWAAGLMLIIHSSRVRNIDYHRMTSFPTKEVFDYFGNEIFEHSEKEIQEFLLKTVFLPKVTQIMAEKMTGNFRAGEILSNLNEKHYFTDRYLETDPVFQYHPLFRDFLLMKAENLFTREEIASLKRNSARLLEETGRLEDAVKLYQDAGDWNEAIRLILNEAKFLLAQGRMKTLEEWIMSIPAEIRKKSPWLLYFLGLCKTPFNPAEGRGLLESAFHLFQEQGDSPGTFLAWSEIVDSFFYQKDDFTPLDPWIAWLDQRMSHEPAFPSPEIEARVACSMIVALIWRTRRYSDVKKWIGRALSLTQEGEDMTLRLQALACSTQYYHYTCDRANSHAVIEEIQRIAHAATASHQVLLHWKCFEAAINIYDNPDQCLQSVSEALLLAEKTGIFISNEALLAMGVWGSFAAGDLTLAGDHLEKMRTFITPARRNMVSLYHILCGWFNFLQGNENHAIVHAENSLRLAIETGTPLPEMLCHHLMALVLHGTGDYKRADDEISRAEQINLDLNIPFFTHLHHLTRSEFAFDRGEEDRGMELLREAMQIGRNGGYVSLLFHWRPSVMARLCAKALEAGIEVDYVQDLIRKLKLICDNPDMENWPWAVKISTLGRFELWMDGKLVQFSKKVQKKPLEMLKVLVAVGGRGVSEGQAIDLLWPEAEGDAAHSVFTTTLSRLRHLLGAEKAVRFHEGRVSLDSRYCYVDAWAFERMCAVVVTASPERKSDLQEFISLVEKALKLYQGRFLPGDEEQLWTASCRERLRNKFLQLITMVGHGLGEAGQWERAVGYYLRGLEVDDLEERLYQQLMVCYQRLGRWADAIRVYSRCRNTLRTTFGVEPSTETQALYKKLTQGVKVRA